MIETLIGVAGPWFFAATALEFAAVLALQAGAPRSPDDEQAPSALSMALSVAFLLTPMLLLAHAFVASRVHGGEDLSGVYLLTAPLAAMVAAALAGAAIGAAVPRAAPMMRAAALGLGFCALAASLWAAWPSLAALAAASQNG